MSAWSTLVARLTTDAAPKRQPQPRDRVHRMLQHDLQRQQREAQAYVARVRARVMREVA